MPGVRSTGGAKRCFGFLLVCWLALSAEAATIQGRVLNSKTGESLAGVTVRIVGTYMGDVSDGSGYYCIDKVRPGQHTLTVASVEFPTDTTASVYVRPEQVLEYDITVTGVMESVVEAKADRLPGSRLTNKVSLVPYDRLLDWVASFSAP